MTVSRTGTTPTPFGFVGKEQYQTDGDSGLQLLGHRYYDPSIGRFLSQDPIQDGTNWYAYCDNNPLTDSDPTGLKPPKKKKKKPKNPWHTTIGSIFGGTAEPISKETGKRKIIRSAFGPYNPVDQKGPEVTDDPGVAVPNPGHHHKVIVLNPANGKQITVPIVDIGPADDNPSGAGIDLTIGAADGLGITYTPGGEGTEGSIKRTTIKWKYAD